MIAAVLAKALHRVMRTVIDAADCRAFRLKTVAHPPRQGRIGVLVEIATTDSRLVGDDDDRPLHLIGPETSQFENSGDEFELVRPVHVAVVHVDHPIPVKKKRTVRHRRSDSLTGALAGFDCRSRSRPQRTADG
jgi:hypothetical protein